MGLIWGANSDLFYINTSFYAAPGADGRAARGGEAPTPRRNRGRGSGDALGSLGQTGPSPPRVWARELGE